jgi:hypothetical protein
MVNNSYGAGICSIDNSHFTKAKHLSYDEEKFIKSEKFTIRFTLHSTEIQPSFWRKMGGGFPFPNPYLSEHLEREQRECAML